MAKGTLLQCARRWRAQALVLCFALAPCAHATCTIEKLAELPVTMDRNQPFIDGQVNGQTVKILVDTGVINSFISESEATKLGLTTVSLRNNEPIYGVGGEAKLRATTLGELKFGPFMAKNLRLSVIGVQRGPHEGEAVFALGEDFFSTFTTEFDLAHGAIRLLRPKGCKFDQLAYWSKDYSMAELIGARLNDPQIKMDVLVNGRPVNAILTTGTARSFISQAAAKASGVGPGEPGTTAVDASIGLVGKRVDTWIGTFGTLTLGDESVRNVKLRIADLFTGDTFRSTGSHIDQALAGMPDMLVGADFFRAHRVLVLYSERKLIFTYNGGPIFQTVAPDLPKFTGGAADSKTADSAQRAD